METSDWIAVIGVAVTGFFSFLVWQATKESAKAAKASANAAIESANAAKASFELTQMIMQKEEKKDHALRYQYRRKALLIAMKVHHALLNQNPNIKVYLIMECPKEPGLSLEEMVTYFSDEEAAQMNRAWDSFNAYLQKHWPNHQTGRDSFSSEEARAASIETSGPIGEFHNLIEMLN
ncbi:hypothetical protein [Brevibacillus reuszeri]|uniref:hypothetical protein n=1 Tax=Brevibacillus reuszeri TaxID=54915 RepID=UPI0028A18888|nr:hypothetical protein [Brevibacillus reuszeri]